MKKEKIIIIVLCILLSLQIKTLSASENLKYKKITDIVPFSNLYKDTDKNKTLRNKEYKSFIRLMYNFAKSKGIKTHVGNIYSSDTFYDERPDLNEQMVRHGIMAVEMEAAELYTLAARFNRKALAILTVSDHLQTGEALPSDEREQTFAQMIDVALAAAFPAK